MIKSQQLKMARFRSLGAELVANHYYKKVDFDRVFSSLGRVFTARMHAVTDTGRGSDTPVRANR